MEQNAEIPHCAPQIGAILTAKAVEPRNLRLYKLENFKDEWSRLAAESGFLSLENAYQPQFQGHHKSSSDPYNTSYISRLYFEEYLNPNSSNSLVESTKVSAVYLRALCRVYLVDFICGDYTLPPVCTDLYSEIDTALAELNEAAHKQSFHMSWSYIRRRIPRNALEILASFLCIFDRSPACEATIVLGEVFEEDDNSESEE